MRFKNTGGAHKAIAKSHKKYQPKRAKKVSVVAAAMVGLVVAPASAYTVKSGDTLGELARKHDTSVSALARINHIKNVNMIRVGQHLKLSTRDAKRVSRSGGNRPAKKNNGRKHCGPIPTAGSWNRHSGYQFTKYAGDITIPGNADFGNPVRAPRKGVVQQVHRWNYSYGNHIVVGHGGEQTLYAHLSDIDVHRGEHVTRCEVIGNVGSSGNSSGAHLHYEIRP